MLGVDLSKSMWKLLITKSLRLLLLTLLQTAMWMESSFLVCQKSQAKSSKKGGQPPRSAFSCYPSKAWMEANHVKLQGSFQRKGTWPFLFPFASSSSFSCSHCCAWMMSLGFDWLSACWRNMYVISGKHICVLPFTKRYVLEHPNI